MVVLNKLDRFHLALDVVDLLPELGPRAAYFRQAIRDRLIEHKEYIQEYGEDMPYITAWRWGETPARTMPSRGAATPRVGNGRRTGGTSTEADNV
jgi:xylulose-5-phosphate/fructose-6-phosphate phosphoketolase